MAPDLSSDFTSLRYNTWPRILMSIVVGVGVGLLGGRGDPLTTWGLGWASGVLTFVVWTAVDIVGLDAQQTAAHVNREDPGRVGLSVLLLAAAVAALVGIGLLLVGRGAQPSGANVRALVGVAVVVASWCLVHLLYTLHYARLYYADTSATPVNFNRADRPDYLDFAYLAFTIGMTYQVSDTNISSRAIRRAVLGHALLSYLLGAVVLATMINLVIQLFG